MGAKAVAKGAHGCPKNSQDRVLEIFEQISAVPRQSKDEERIRIFISDWAARMQFKCLRDEVGNVLVKVPASPGLEKKSPIVLQGHMDMVCEKVPESSHDFSKDPIRLLQEKQWLRAEGTSLGADNGIALAVAMAIAEDPLIKHPPLELLFTTDEETGLSGVRGLKPDFLSGKQLINIDSEDEGIFIVGCAGGKDTNMAMPLEYEAFYGEFKPFVLTVKGMIGGHSGLSIHEERGNAIQVLARVLHEAERKTGARIVGINGGTAHNAIPRSAVASVFVPSGSVKAFEELVSAVGKALADEFKNTDPDLEATIEEFQPSDDRCMSAHITRKLIQLLLTIHHGAWTYSKDLPGTVESSSNLAKAWVENGELHLLTSQRSSCSSRLHAITHRVEAAGLLAGARVETGNGYPPWKPDFNSKLLKTCKKLYKQIFDEEPKVKTVHAGLECGMIGALYPGMDMISVGPTIKDPHSPAERMHIPTVGKLWAFMIELLKSL